LSTRDDVRQFLETKLNQLRAEVRLSEILVASVPDLLVRIAEIESWLASADKNEAVFVPVGAKTSRVTNVPVVEPPNDRT
jgi:hypothetical protein